MALVLLGVSAEIPPQIKAEGRCSVLSRVSLIDRERCNTILERAAA